MDVLLERSESLVQQVEPAFKRYLYNQINWDNRLIGIKGPRGTGKTTILLQRLQELGLDATKAAYFTLDDFYFTTNALSETAGNFYKKGGQYLFLDEVHKYPEWARHIKNIYDLYPRLKIVFTGSSIIDIAREEADLSRRARMYELQGLSYREYLSYSDILHTGPLTLDTILSGPSSWRPHFPGSFRPLEHFEDYLIRGYYPFFREDREGLPSRLQQLIRAIVEYDMAELHDFDIRNAKKMLQLLYVIASNVPFKPNITQLSEKSQIHRNTVNSYLHFLEQARLIRLLYPGGISVATLQKPEKIYLDNPNIAFVLSHENPDKGNLRETFFLNQVSQKHHVNYPKQGDFMVDRKWTFEISGKAKNSRQIKGIEHSFVVVDDAAFPVTTGIPLWLFGFLY